MLLVTTIKAQEVPRGLGIGVIIGEPTGISIKKWTGGNNAFQAAAAWSFVGYESFQFQADYLFHNFGLLNSSEMSGALPVYVGIGGRIKLAENADNTDHNDALLGVRVPLGISYIFENTPLDIFLEVAPILDLVPATDFNIDGAVGLRFYL